MDNANANVRGRRNSGDDDKKQEKKRDSLKPHSGNTNPEWNAQKEQGERRVSLKKKEVAIVSDDSRNPPTPPFEKQGPQIFISENLKKLQKTQGGVPAFLNVVKMAMSQKKHVNIIEEKPLVKRKKRNSKKALLVKRKLSKVLPVKPSPTSPTGSQEQQEYEEEEVGPQPAPYWVTILGDKKDLINRLKNVTGIGEAVDHNPDLLTYLFKHPTFGKKVTEETELAHEVIEHPKNFKEIAHKEAMKVKGPNLHQHGHPITFLGHKYHIDDVRIHPEDRFQMISRSQLSLARDQEIYDGSHNLKALMGMERIYLRHDEIVYEGFLVFCDRKMHRFFFLDVNGKVIYHIRDYQVFTNDCLRRFDFALLDLDGKEVLRMKKGFSLTSKQRVDVYCPPGNFIGCVSQSYGVGTPSFWIKNHEKHKFIEIRSCGRNWKSYCDKKDYKFEFIIKVVATQHDMGLISTMWLEKQMETYSFEPFYGIHWNDEMALNVKGLLLSSMLLVYMTCYNGRIEKRLYVERYKTPGRPSFSVCEEDLQT